MLMHFLQKLLGLFGMCRMHVSCPAIIMSMITMTALAFEHILWLTVLVAHGA